MPYVFVLHKNIKPDDHAKYIVGDIYINTIGELCCLEPSQVKDDNMMGSVSACLYNVPRGIATGLVCFWVFRNNETGYIVLRNDDDDDDSLTMLGLCFNEYV